VTNASLQIELGYFGNQKDVPAARAFRAAKISRHGLLGVAGELSGHRRLLLDARGTLI
jgi:hypothetical protein